MAQTTIRFLIWTVETEPCGLDEDGTWYDDPAWYYISDDKIHCFGYAPGLFRAAWNYLCNIHKTITLNRWYRDRR